MTPDEALTVAMFVLELVQAPPLTVEANVVVPATHTVCVPESVPAEVAGVTVTVIVLE